VGVVIVYSYIENLSKKRGKTGWNATTLYDILKQKELEVNQMANTKKLHEQNVPMRCAILAREQGKLDLGGNETVSLTPLMTDPIFVQGL